ADKVINLLAVYTPDGGRRDYAKIHLYDAFGFKESDTVEPGEEPVVISIDGEDVGLALCYDIRFPKLFAALSRRGARLAVVAAARRGAGLAVVAAAWGAGPGKVEQWGIPARARALDPNMFGAALGQADPEVAGVEVPTKGPTGVGHSPVSYPFGHVLSSLDGA